MNSDKTIYNCKIKIAETNRCKESWKPCFSTLSCDRKKGHKGQHHAHSTCVEGKCYARWDN